MFLVFILEEDGIRMLVIFFIYIYIYIFIYIYLTYVYVGGEGK